MASKAEARYRDRIVGHGYESPEQMMANPMNFRVHPSEQREVMGEVLEAVGWVQEVVVNRVTGNLVDGHLRVLLAMQAGEEQIPVEYVELSEAEERLVLAVYDRLALMAGEDEAKLGELLAEVGEELEALLAGDEKPGLEAMLAEMLEEVGELDVTGELGDFGEFAQVDAELGAYVDFKLGHYKGKVSKAVYESFEAKYGEVKHEHAEYAVLDDILRAWLGV